VQHALGECLIGDGELTRCNNRLRQMDDDLCAVERVQRIDGPPVAAAAAVKLASRISSAG